jgi:hypothetical protein
MTTPREHVAAGVRGHVLGLLGRHVLRLAHEDLAFLVLHQVAGLGDAEVRDLDLALGGDHEVLGGDVAVDDAQRGAVLVALRVRVFEAAADAGDDERAQLVRDLLAQLDVAVHELLNVDAVHELHRDVVLVADAAQLVDLDDVLVDQVGDELGLADEHVDEVPVARELLADGLDRDGFFEPFGAEQVGLVDGAHAAVGDLAGEPELVGVFEFVRLGHVLGHDRRILTCPPIPCQGDDKEPFLLPAILASPRQLS